MKKREWLEQTLRDGLMFTNHEVKFDIVAAYKDQPSFVNEMIRIIDFRLNELGADKLKNLPEDRKMAILHGIGSIQGNIPMLCFTEIADGKDIRLHKEKFGEYGLLIKRQWLESKGADRVIYIGENTRLSNLLAINLSTFRILTLNNKNLNNLVTYNSYFMEMILNLFCFFQSRNNIGEQEFRLPGNHGFTNGKSSAGERLQIPISEIEEVYVKEFDEIGLFKDILNERVKNDEYHRSIPTVSLMPESIRFSHSHL